MHERPPDFTDAELAAALSRHWRLELSALDYLPAGFGGFHWTAAGRDGQRWFVTVSAIRHDGQLADLTATLTTASGLAAAGLPFVVAPRAAAGGQLVVTTRPDYAIALYPFADGVPGHWGDQLSAADQDDVIRMLAVLHGTGGPALPPVRPPGLPGLTVIEAAVRDSTRPWPGTGPFSEPARTLVAEHAGRLLAAAARFRELASAIAADGRDLVITHGEPHAGNLIHAPAGLLLVDWDTAGLAPPERDLWWVVRDSAAAGRYRDLTGRTVSQAALALYRLRWDLDDISLYLAEFRAPHQRSEDTEMAFAGLTAGVRGLA